MIWRATIREGASDMRHTTLSRRVSSCAITDSVTDFLPEAALAKSFSIWRSVSPYEIFTFCFSISCCLNSENARVRFLPCIPGRSGRRSMADLGDCERYAFNPRRVPSARSFFSFARSSLINVLLYPSWFGWAGAVMRDRCRVSQGCDCKSLRSRERADDRITARSYSFCHHVQLEWSGFLDFFKHDCRHFLRRDGRCFFRSRNSE